MKNLRRLVALRLTDAEYARLRVLARGKPLAGFARSLLLPALEKPK